MSDKILILVNDKIEAYASRVRIVKNPCVDNDEITAISRHIAVSGILENVDIRKMWRDNRGVLVICWDVKTIWGDYATYKYHDLMWYPWSE